MTSDLPTKGNKVEYPAAHFDKPIDVVNDKSLSDDEKKKALNTWEQDTRQQMTASNEGMTASKEGHKPDDHNLMGEVVGAKDKIGEKAKHKPAQ